MVVQAKYIHLEEFNNIIEKLRGRNFIYSRPMRDNILAWDAYVYKDGQSNIHLIYKDAQDKNNPRDKKTIHLAFDPVDMERPEKFEKHKNAGRDAFKEANFWCSLYGDTLDYAKNKDFIIYHDDEKDIVAYMYHYTNNDPKLRNNWQKHCYGYDMNSCFPYFLTKPLPYGDIIRTNDIVRDGELGFYNDLTYQNKESLKLALPGERATYIFKTKIYKGLTEFAKSWYTKKKDADGDEKDEAKLILNALIGNMKYHNIFIRITVLEYARLYMESLRDENTLVQTVDSIVSLKPRTDLIIGTELGQFKCEHQDQSFIYKNDMTKRWSGEETKKTGLKSGRKNGNFELIKPGYDFDYSQNKIIKCKEIWSRLWDEENLN